MTGPEHYVTAEKLLYRHFTEPGSDHLAEAQVHGTLALAAAIALMAGTNPQVIKHEFEAWERAAGTTPPQEMTSATVMR